MLIVTVNSAPLAEVLSKLLSKLDDLTPAMAGIGQEMESRVSGRLETETDPLGHHWAGWAPARVATYPKDGNHRILDRYDDMLASLNHQASSRSVRIGFGSPEAAFHEWGTKDMPRRGMLLADPDAGTISTADEQAVLAILNTFLELA